MHNVTFRLSFMCNLCLLIELRQAASGTLDGILDTVSAIHPLLPLLSLLKFEGKLVLLGATKALELPVPPLLTGEKHIAMC